MDFKKPLTLDKQIIYLKNNKRLKYDLVSENVAKEFLYTNNYINTISPFKYVFAKKDKDGVPIKKDNKHIYERDVDFKEYIDQYIQERNKYPIIYKTISDFECVFNSIVSYEVINHYHIDSQTSFDNFINELMTNVTNSKEKPIVKNHMTKTFTSFNDYLQKYGSVYILFDRLSLNEIVSVYKMVNKKLSDKIFNELLCRDYTFNYPVKKQFDDALIKLVRIRNCVYHGDSLTILIRYFNVKKKSLRTSTDKRKYETLLKRLL